MATAAQPLQLQPQQSPPSFAEDREQSGSDGSRAEFSRMEELERSRSEALAEADAYRSELLRMVEGVRILTRIVKRRGGGGGGGSSSASAGSKLAESSSEVESAAARGDGDEEMRDVTAHKETINRSGPRREGGSSSLQLSSSSSLEAFLTDDQHRLSDISAASASVDVGRDILALSNAVHMVRENSLLSISEASMAIEDARASQSAAKDAQGRADKAERAARRLYRENKQLKSDLEKVNGEKAVLVRQVRKLLRQKEARDAAEKEVLSREVEAEVARAIMKHEEVLLAGKQQQQEQKADGSADEKRESPDEEGVAKKPETAMIKEYKPVTLVQVGKSRKSPPSPAHGESSSIAAAPVTPKKLSSKFYDLAGGAAFSAAAYSYGSGDSSSNRKRQCLIPIVDTDKPNDAPLRGAKSVVTPAAASGDDNDDDEVPLTPLDYSPESMAESVTKLMSTRAGSNDDFDEEESKASSCRSDADALRGMAIPSCVSPEVNKSSSAEDFIHIEDETDKTAAAVAASAAADDFVEVKDGESATLRGRSDATAGGMTPDGKGKEAAKSPARRSETAPPQAPSLLPAKGGVAEAATSTKGGVSAGLEKAAASLSLRAAGSGISFSKARERLMQPRSIPMKMAFLFDYDEA